MVGRRVILVIGLLGLLSACAVPGPGEAPDGVFDPNEAENRQVHEFNRSVDKRFFGGGQERSGPGAPEGVVQVVGNVADTVSLPKTVVNQVLQGRLGRATRNTLRFGINATLGFAGLMDVASDLGLPEDESDFGETLFVWGVPEGAYMELPLLGPSTERATAGLVVDFFLDPLDRVLSTPARRTKTALRVADRALSRQQYGDTVDSVLHDSADSYSQLRLIYLQNRRFELGDTDSAGADTYIDPDAIDTEGF